MPPARSFAPVAQLVEAPDLGSGGWGFESLPGYMAIDGKYGRVTIEHGNIGEDEPVVVFRSQDRLLPKLLKVYKIMCELAGSPQRHLDLIDETAARVKAWQEINPTKTPSSDSLA